MIAGIIIMLVFLIIGLTIVACLYLYLCSENECGIFNKDIYFTEKDIEKLIKNIIKELEDKKNE